MKECNICKILKEDTEFPTMGKRISSYCRPCKQKYQREKYLERQDEILKNKRISQKILRDKNYNVINSIKDVPCMDCGLKFPPICMDFDHPPDVEKIDNVSCLVRNSLNKALEEIEKCDIVCANCHRIRTFNRNNQGVR